MISIEEIDKTILDLEQHDTTYAACEKLAWLYIVRDHLRGNVSRATRETVIQTAGSEFIEACSGRDTIEVLSILDEHMEAIKSIYPKEYNTLITKIKKLDRA